MSEVYRPETKYPETSVRQLLNQSEVKTYADTQLINCYKELNIDIPFLTKEKKDLYEIAKKKQDVRNGLNVIHSIQEDMGLNNKVKVTETRQTNSNLAENFQNAVKQTKKVTIETEVKPEASQDDTQVSKDA